MIPPSESLKKRQSLLEIVNQIKADDADELDKLVGFFLKRSLQTNCQINGKNQLDYFWDEKLGGYSLPCELRVIDDQLYFFVPDVNTLGFPRKNPQRGNHSPFVDSLIHRQDMKKMELAFLQRVGCQDTDEFDSKYSKMVVGKKQCVYHKLVITPDGIKLVIYGRPTSVQKSLLTELQERWQYLTDKKFSIKVVSDSDKAVSQTDKITDLKEIDSPLIENVYTYVDFYDDLPQPVVYKSNSKEGRVTLESREPRDISTADIFYGVGIANNEGEDKFKVELIFIPQAKNHDQVIGGLVAKGLNRSLKKQLFAGGKHRVEVENRQVRSEYNQLMDTSTPFPVKLWGEEVSLGVRAEMDVNPQTRQIKIEIFASHKPTRVSSEEFKQTLTKVGEKIGQAIQKSTSQTLIPKDQLEKLKIKPVILWLS